MRTINTIFVHYTATPPDMDVTMSRIRDWHRKRGFKREGYHFLVRRDLTIEEGRPLSMVGAHVRGHNADSIGVTWEGGVEPGAPNVGLANFAPGQEEKLIELLRDLTKRFPNAKVLGHRDVAPTQCPGFDVRPWWERHGEHPFTAPPVKTPGGMADDDELNIRPICERLCERIAALLNLKN